MRRPRDAIREALSRVWDSGGREFVTFELVGPDDRPDGDRWAQWLEGEVNLRWPLDEDPRTALPRLGAPPPPGAYVAFHAPGENVIVNVLDARIDDVADFLDRCFARVLARDVRYRVEARVEAHR